MNNLDGLNMFVSIIVPVYNIEKYIGKCLDSILEACSEDCEIILVTGASSDRSNEICSQYQARYSSIRIVRQNGKGLSNARNCATAVAGGEFIFYIDGDDYIDSQLFKNLLDRLRDEKNDLDLVVTDFHRISLNSGRVQNVFQIGEGSEPIYGMDFLPRMLRKKECFWNAWRFGYRSTFLQEHGISFLENKLSEDIDHTTRVLLASPRIMFLHCPFYYYTLGRGDSLMDRPTYKRLKDTVDILCRCIDLTDKSSFGHAQLLIGQYQFEYILNLATLCEMTRTERKKARDLYTKTVGILGIGSDQTIRLIRKMLYLLPVSLTAEGLHLLKISRRLAKRGNM